MHSEPGIPPPASHPAWIPSRPGQLWRSTLSSTISAFVAPLNLGQTGDDFFDLLKEALTPREGVRVARAVLLGGGLAVTSRPGDNAHLVKFAEVEGKVALVVTAPSWCSWDKPSHYRFSYMLQQWGVDDDVIRHLIGDAKMCVTEYKAA